MRRRWVGGGILASLIFTLLLAGCGSGGGEDTSSPSAQPPPLSIAAPWGLWTGTTGDGRTVRGAVADNSYWFWYSAIGDPTVLRGGAHGTFDHQTEGVLASSDLVDFSMDRTRVWQGTLTGTYVKQQTINGTMTVRDPLSHGNNESMLFSLIYQPNSGSAPDNLGNPDPNVLADMGQIVATYEGQNGGASPATITISQGGDFSIQGYFSGSGGTKWETGPCPTTSGSIFPQNWGVKAYRFFMKDDCLFPIRWMDGVSVFDAATNKLFLFAVDRNTAFIHEITKQ